jgi:hypothetical protein
MLPPLPAAISACEEGPAMINHMCSALLVVLMLSVG